MPPYKYSLNNGELLARQLKLLKDYREVLVHSGGKEQLRWRHQHDGNNTELTAISNSVKTYSTSCCGADGSFNVTTTGSTAYQYSLDSLHWRDTTRFMTGAGNYRLLMKMPGLHR